MPSHAEDHQERYGILRRELDLLKADLRNVHRIQAGHKELARITTEIESTEAALLAVEWQLEKLGVPPSDKHYWTNATQDEMAKLATYWDETFKVEALPLNSIGVVF